MLGGVFFLLVWFEGEDVVELEGGVDVHGEGLLRDG